MKKQKQLSENQQRVLDDLRIGAQLKFDTKLKYWFLSSGQFTLAVNANTAFALIERDLIEPDIENEHITIYKLKDA